MKTLITLCAALLCVCSVQAQERSKSKEGAEVYIISPKDGDVIKGDVTVVFGLKGMGVAPAGTAMEGTGHHHLLIDTEKLPAMNLPLAATEKSKHFGAGQTETTLKLDKGKHTLQLVFADFAHIPHDPPLMSKKITITVK